MGVASRIGLACGSGCGATLPGHAWLVVNGLDREQVTVSVQGAIAKLARRVGHADVTIDDTDNEELLQPDQG